MHSILIGKIVNVHGIKGEVKVYTYTDDIEQLAQVKEIFFDEKLTKSYLVNSCKTIKNMLIWKLEKIDTVEQATLLKDTDIYIPKVEDLEEDTYYIEDLIGLEVIEIDTNDSLGKITYVFNTGANDVYEIENMDAQKIYLPAIKQVVQKVDIPNKKMYVKMMDGLL